MHKLSPVVAGEMNYSPELMGIYVAPGLSETGANRYSFLQRQGACNTSDAGLGAGNPNVQRLVSASEELTNWQWRRTQGINTVPWWSGWAALMEGTARRQLPKQGDIPVHLDG